MAALQREDFRGFLARKKGDYCSKFPFLTERQIIAKLRRIWSSQKTSNVSGSLDKRNDVTFNRPCQTRSTATTLEHRPNKRKHKRQGFFDSSSNPPLEDKENTLKCAHAINSNSSELMASLSQSSTFGLSDRTSCYDFPIAGTSPPVTPPSRLIVRPVLKLVSSDATPSDLLTPLSQSQSDKASDLIGSLDDDRSVNREGKQSSNSQNGCVSRHSMRLRSSWNKPHPLGTSHSQCGNRAVIDGQRVKKRRVRFMGQQVLTFEPKLPVSSTTTNIHSELLIVTQQVPYSPPGEESNMKEVPPDACQTETLRSNSSPKGSPGNGEVAPFVPDNELNSCQGDDTSVVSDLANVDGGNVESVCIPRNEHSNGFNQSVESNELEIYINNKHQAGAVESQQGEGLSTTDVGSGNIRKTRKKRGGKHRQSGMRQTRIANRKRSAVVPQSSVESDEDSSQSAAKRPRLIPPSQEQDGTDTPIDEQDTPTLEIQAPTEDQNQPAEEKDEPAQDQTIPDEPRLSGAQSDKSIPANPLPNKPPSVLTPVAADPLCDMFLPLTPEREKYGFFKDSTSFFHNSLSERRVFRSSATVAASSSAANSQENTYCMFDNEADIFM